MRLRPLGLSLSSLSFAFNSQIGQQQSTQTVSDKEVSNDTPQAHTQQLPEKVYASKLSTDTFSYASNLHTPSAMASIAHTFASQQGYFDASLPTPEKPVNRGAPYLVFSVIATMPSDEDASNHASLPQQVNNTSHPSLFPGSLCSSLQALNLDSSFSTASLKYGIYENYSSQAAINAGDDMDMSSENPSATAQVNYLSSAFDNAVSQMKVEDEPTELGALQSLLNNRSSQVFNKKKIPVEERRQRNGSQRSHEKRQAVKEQASLERKLAQSSRRDKAQDLHAQNRNKALQKRRSELVQQQMLQHQAEQWVLQQEADQQELQERELAGRAREQPTNPRKRRQHLHAPYDVSEEGDRQKEVWLLTGRHVLRRQSVTFSVPAEDVW